MLSLFNLIQAFVDVLLIVNSGNIHINLRKMENIHWHLRNEYFIALNKFVKYHPNVCGLSVAH